MWGKSAGREVENVEEAWAGRYGMVGMHREPGRQKKEPRVGVGVRGQVGVGVCVVGVGGAAG